MKTVLFRISSEAARETKAMADYVGVDLSTYLRIATQELNEKMQGARLGSILDRLEDSALSESQLLDHLSSDGLDI